MAGFGFLKQLGFTGTGSFLTNFNVILEPLNFETYYPL